jgi:uncharacterized iron-regulated membrane protein
MVSTRPEIPRAPDKLSGAYRAVWRWHFYAGLIVLPFLMLMALTGGVYLFRAEIEDAMRRPMIEVAPQTSAASPDRWIASAAVAGGGAASTVRVSDRPDRTVAVTVTRPDQSRVLVFVDPHDAQVRGVVPAEGLTETISKLHSLALVGTWANIVVEIVAGWAMILVATGLYLWWPRRRQAGVVSIRAKSGRPFWRDLHAVAGLYAGGVIFFLALTGMPWSAVWGAKYHQLVSEHGLGRPPAPVAQSWEHAAHGQGPANAGWTMEDTVLPGASHPIAPSLERVLQTASASGLARPWTVSIPADHRLTWTVTRATGRVEDTRLVYVDAGSGVVKADVHYDQFGPGAKAFEWGVAVHQGTQYGWLNRYIMLGGCIAIWILAVSGLVMWWRRRPSRRLGAPVAPPGPRVRAAVLGIVLPFAVLFPLTGLSLIAAVVIDLAARRVAPLIFKPAA